MRLPREYPTTYTDTPSGFSTGSARYEDLRLAGFHGGPDGITVSHTPGTPTTDDELLVDGRLLQLEPGIAATILASTTFRVLLDPDGRIVAAWDEERWWTPSECDAFTRDSTDWYRG